MKEKTFYVSHEEKQLGPFSQEAILLLISQGDLSPLDYVFDEASQDWVVLMNHDSFVSLIDDRSPNQAGSSKSSFAHSIRSSHQSDQVAAKERNHTEVNEANKRERQKNDNVFPLNAQSNPDHLVTEWYVLKGENKFGPFAFTDVVKMLQQKVVFEFDFAWHPKMTSWKRIAEIDSFHHDNIKKLKTTLMPEIEELFFRRRHRRTDFNGTILVHDNKSVWKGQGVEISAGGAGLIMENAMVVPGQVLYLHFKPCDGVPPFNAVCEVVSKQYVDGVKEKSAPIKYGVKFTSISPTAQTVLADYTKKSVAA